MLERDEILNFWDFLMKNNPEEMKRVRFQTIFATNFVINKYGNGITLDTLYTETARFFKIIGKHTTVANGCANAVNEALKEIENKTVRCDRSGNCDVYYPLEIKKHEDCDEKKEEDINNIFEHYEDL